MVVAGEVERALTGVSTGVSNVLKQNASDVERTLLGALFSAMEGGGDLHAYGPDAVRSVIDRLNRDGIVAPAARP